MNIDDLKAIFSRIANKQQTEDDISVLQQALVDRNEEISIQLGKFNVNIAEGQGIHIGDRTYNQWDEEAVKALIQAVEGNKQAIEALLKTLEQLIGVTLRVSKQGLKILDRQRRIKRWAAVAPSWCDNAQTSVAILKQFRQKRPISQAQFVAICKAVGIENWPDIVDNTPPTQANSRPDFFAYDDAWTGREQIVTELSNKLRGPCRLLLLLGLTGIGKTALAEKLAVELQDWFGGDWKNKFRLARFDYDDKATDFASVAARWFEEWGQRLSPEEKKPELLLNRLVKYLRENQVLVLIDSVERLLTGNQEGWGDFADEWWEKFFLNLLSAEYCQSRLIITSQDLPVKLLVGRYQKFWHRQILYGLTEFEQIALFERTGLDVDEESPDRPLLLRIGKAYKGHPLVLRVIIGEILSEPFNGDVQAYWNDDRENTSQKIEEVERALAEAEQGKTLGEKDEWKLHQLTKKVRDEVNKERLQISFERLAKDVKDAYILICAASVYRAPEKEEYWLKHLVYWLKRLGQQECSKDRLIRAIEELDNRFLVEASLNHNKKRVLGQHNLIRSVAIEHRKQLLQSLNTGE